MINICGFGRAWDLGAHIESRDELSTWIESDVDVGDEEEEERNTRAGAELEIESESTEEALDH